VRVLEEAHELPLALRGLRVVGAAHGVGEDGGHRPGGVGGAGGVGGGPGLGHEGAEPGVEHEARDGGGRGRAVCLHDGAALERALELVRHRARRRGRQGGRKAGAATVRVLEEAHELPLALRGLRVVGAAHGVGEDGGHRPGGVGGAGGVGGGPGLGHEGAEPGVEHEARDGGGRGGAVCVHDGAATGQVEPRFLHEVDVLLRGLGTLTRLEGKHRPPPARHLPPAGDDAVGDIPVLRARHPGVDALPHRSQ